MDLVFIAEMLLIGAGVGVISNALGLGGGILMVPAFIYFVAGMDAHTAKGTSLFIIIFVSAVNAWKLNQGVENIQGKLAFVIACGSVIGGFASAWITGLMPEAVVLWIFIALLAVVAVLTFFIEARPTHTTRGGRRWLTAFGIGLVAGIASGATGTGGSAILIPLALLTGLVHNERVVAMFNMVMIATCISSTAAHLLGEKTSELSWTVGQVNFALAPPVFLGAMLSAPLGRFINAKLTLKRRRIAMGIVLAMIALSLIQRALKG